jgi:hypothetical protein
MATEVCGPTNDPFPGSVMGPRATVSVVGSRGPTRQEKYAEGRRNALSNHASTIGTGEASPVDPTPIWAERPEKVPFLPDEDTRPVEKSLL